MQVQHLYKRHPASRCAVYACAEYLSRYPDLPALMSAKQKKASGHGKDALASGDPVSMDKDKAKSHIAAIISAR